MNLPRIFLVAFALTVAMPVTAQTWPSKPVTIVVPYIPGAGGDVMARFLAHQLHERTGQPFIVLNKPGASSLLGTQLVARAAPDGYTFLLNTVSAAMNVHLFKELGYDQVRDFTPVSVIAISAFVLLINPAVVPVTSVADLTEYIRTRSDKIAYGGGTAARVASAYYFSLSGLRREQLTFIPYKGTPEALRDLMGGRIHFTFVTVELALQQVRAGKLRALAITGANRTPAAPDLPTMVEAGLPNYDLVGWYAIYMPAKAPKDIAQKLAELCKASISTEKGRAFLKALSMDPYPSSPESIAQYLNDETAKWGRLIKDAGIEPE